MQSSMSDEAMMREITAHVASVKRAEAAAKRRKIKDPDSPYLVDQVKLLPAECFPKNDSMQTIERMRKRVEREALRKRKPTDPDEILNYYAAQERKDLGVPKETLEAKALTLPFGDTISKINEYVALDRTVRSSEQSFDQYNRTYTSDYTTTRSSLSRSISQIPLVSAGKADGTGTRSRGATLSATQSQPNLPLSSTSSSHAIKSTSTSTVPPATEKAPETRFHRKYPRFCASLHFTDADLEQVNSQQRSDYWMARFIEDCYDCAYTMGNTPVCKESKWRLRNGLDLGSLECFPKAVERVFCTRYSVLEVRKQVCLEFLCGLERLITVSEKARISALPASAVAVQEIGEHVYDGERAQMFARFLSEEYDLDFLAIFLQVREVVQTVFHFRLRDLTQARVFLDGVSGGGEDGDGGGGGGKTGAAAFWETGMAAFTYYRTQQRGNTSDLPDSTTMRSGAKRKLAWSAETLTLTAKLDAQIGARKTARRGDGNRSSTGTGGTGTGVREGEFSSSPTKRSRSVTASAAGSPSVSPTKGLSRSTSAPFTSTSNGMDTFDGVGADGDGEEQLAGADKTIAERLHPAPEGKKVVPVSLPNNWHFLHDLTMPEAPIVGFELGLMAVLCMHLLPQTSQSVRTYLTDRIVAMTKEALLDTTAAVTNLASDASVLDETGRVSVSSARNSYAAGKIIRIIPLSIFLKTLCSEWKKLSLETKVSFIESGAGSASLRELNVLCADNNELMRQLDAEIHDNDTLLGAAVSRVLGLEKTIRRLERRRQLDTATVEELERLAEARVSLNSEKTVRSELESHAAALAARKQALQDRIETLWKKATFNSLPVVRSNRRRKFQPGQQKAMTEADKRIPTAEEQIAARHSDWKKVVSSWLVKVMVANVEEYQAMQRATLQKSQKEHRERESRRIAAEEAALIAAEARRPLSTQSERPRTRGSDIHTPGPAQQFFVLEVLAKVFVRNVLRDGVRRVSLAEYLRRKEHELLLIYGSHEYKRKDRERLLREKEEREQRQRYLLRVQAAKAMSGGIVDHTFGLAKASAEVLLFDPWTLLDLHPSTWLSPAVLHAVEDKYQVAVQRYRRKCLKNLFHYLRREWGVARLRRRQNHRTCKLCLRSMWRDMMAVRHLNKCAAKIQAVIRAFTYRQRCAAHLQYQRACHQRAVEHEKRVLQVKRGKCFRFWRKECSLAYRLKATIFALKERRFIITFYTWRDQFKKHRLSRIQLTEKQLRACISLQAAVRCFVAWRKFRALWAKKRIGGLARQYLARRWVQAERERERRLVDYHRSVSQVQVALELRRHFAAWRRCKCVIAGVAHLDRAVVNDKLRRRFKKWVNLAQHRTRRLAVRAVKIQSLVRMWLTHKYVLHYYRWRRGLVKFQAIYRTRLAVRQYVYDIFFYRMAKRIQRVFRGYRCRIHLNDQRVIDIHYAAAHNNYDRLNYYVGKFPELITMPDAEGNNALHSAAKTASKRTLKLLMRHKFLDPNAKNPQGYTPLHLTIMSVSPQRDDCYLYMMERGFSDEIQGPDGKTTLLIAAEYGRTIITRHLLVEEDHNPNIADANGTTALQTACWQGNLAMVRDLIDNEADVNQPGYNGTFPLHDCVYGGNAEIAQMLLAHGAYVNVYEPYLYQTPLMYACSAGRGDIARLYLIAGAEVNARDSKGQTAAHHGVASNSADVYNALREADADFDGQDNEGNSPLHLAAETGASEFAIAMLHGGAYPSWQNHRGDQPAHIAARYNQLDMLQQICRYDEHIGRVNYDHQTPLGVAKFHLSKECQAFLTKHYRMVEVQDGRNKVGEVWWDKEVDAAVGDWEVSVNAAGERFYMNRRTAEVSMVPPAMSASQLAQIAQKAELPLHRTVTIVKEENTLTKHAYYLDFAEKEKDVAAIAKDYVNATIIVKYARRKLAYLALARAKAHKRRTKVLTRFIKRHLPGFMMWRHFVYTKCATKIQARYRGYRLRKRYFAWPKGEYFRRRLAKAHWRLRYKLWALWKFYLRRQEFKLMRLSNNQPKTLHDWQIIIDQARRPVRKVGIFEDYLYPGTHNIHFYRHSLTGVCSFTKPKKMKIIDEMATIERQQVKKYGATIKQITLATKLQALWRGYQVRTYGKYVARALQISLHAESAYLSNPDVDANLYNYALYCFVGLQDLSRARRAFVEALRRMQWRGPDIPFVLYSYSIFALVARDEGYQDVMLLLTRARQAEVELDAIKRSKLGATDATPAKVAEGDFRYGKSFDLANTGFFRHMAIQSRNSFGWEAFAVCRFLVYRDFNGSFDAFLQAFRFAPEDKFLMENFNIMMIHFHGKNKEHRDEVYKARQQKLAQMDADVQEQIRQRRAHAQLRSDSARRIQEWYKKCKENRVYQAFMEGVRSIIRRRRRAASSQPGRRSVGSSQGRRRDDGFGSRSTVATPEGGQRRGMASVVKGARAFSPTPSSPATGGGMGRLSRAQSPQSATYR